MKQLFFALMAISFTALAACNSGNEKSHDGHNMNNADSMKKMDSMGTTGSDTAGHAGIPENKEIKAIAVAYTNVDTKVAASMKAIVDHYLELKNALTNDNSNEAASHGQAMESAIKKLDKSFLTADQKKVWDGFEDDLREHAEHIGKNAGNIKHQREHFSLMSEDVYDLVKSFGGGRAIYHDHCPMYNENKGAIWLSETKEVRNPYFGTKMPACGTVEEVIQ